MRKTIDWNSVREQWNKTGGVSFRDFCGSLDLPWRTALKHYREWVKAARYDLSEAIRNSQKTDIETADHLSRILQNALATIDPADLKNLKELSSILNQISSTRKNIFNYLPGGKGEEEREDWTRSLTIVSDQDDAV